MYKDICKLLSFWKLISINVEKYMRTRSCEYCDEVKDIPALFCFVRIFFKKGIITKGNNFPIEKIKKLFMEYYENVLPLK